MIHKASSLSFMFSLYSYCGVDSNFATLAPETQVWTRSPPAYLSQNGYDAPCHLKITCGLGQLVFGAGKHHTLGAKPTDETHNPTSQQNIQPEPSQKYGIRRAPTRHYDHNVMRGVGLPMFGAGKCHPLSIDTTKDTNPTSETRPSTDINLIVIETTWHTSMKKPQLARCQEQYNGARCGITRWLDSRSLRVSCFPSWGFMFSLMVHLLWGFMFSLVGFHVFPEGFISWLWQV